MRRVRLTDVLGGLCCKLSDPEVLTLLLCVPEIILGLQIEPTFCGCCKSNRKTYRHLRADARSFVENGREGFTTNTETFSRIGYSQTEGLKTKRSDNLSGMGG